MDMREALKTFSLGYIFALVAIFLLALALQYFFDYEPSAGLGFVASLTGALWTGQRYAMQYNSKPPSGFSWKFAVLSFVPALIISLIAAAIIAAFAGGGALAATYNSIPASFWLIGVMFALLLHVLAARFFISFGAGNYLNALANKKDKDN